MIVRSFNKKDDFFFQLLMVRGKPIPYTMILHLSFIMFICPQSHKLQIFKLILIYLKVQREVKVRFYKGRGNQTDIHFFEVLQQPLPRDFGDENFVEFGGVLKLFTIFFLKTVHPSDSPCNSYYFFSNCFVDTSCFASIFFDVLLSSLTIFSPFIPYY